MPGFTRAVRRYNKNPSRRKVAGVGGETYRGRRTPIVPVTVGPHSTSDVPIVFNGPCFLVAGYTPGLHVGSFACTGATQTSPTIITFHFGGLGPWTGDVTIPFEDPSVRNLAGGYMQPGVYVQET